MVTKTKISLIIKGRFTENDFRDLSFLSEFGKISFRKKGEIISRVVSPLDMNVFTFTVDLCDKSDMLAFLSIINDLKLDRLTKNNDIKLRLYMQSDSAQIYLLLTKNILQDIANLNIDMEISILSWGECE